MCALEAVGVVGVVGNAVYIVDAVEDVCCAVDMGSAVDAVEIVINVIKVEAVDRPVDVVDVSDAKGCAVFEADFADEVSDEVR